MVYSMFKVGQPSTIQFHNIFMPYNQPLLTVSSHSPPPASPRLSVIYFLPILSLFYKWNHTTCGLLCLASFT